MAMIKGKRGRDVIIAAMGLALIATAASAVDWQAPRKKSSGNEITVLYPEIDPTTASGCVAEAAAYAQAVAALEIAEEAARQAYEAWYDCEMANMQPAPVDMSQIPSQSVLLRD